MGYCNAFSLSIRLILFSPSCQHFHAVCFCHCLPGWLFELQLDPGVQRRLHYNSSCVSLHSPLGNFIRFSLLFFIFVSWITVTFFSRLQKEMITIYYSYTSRKVIKSRKQIPTALKPSLYFIAADKQHNLFQVRLSFGR